MNEKLPEIVPKHVHSGPVSVTAYFSTGSQQVVDCATLQTTINTIVDALNHNAQALTRALDFVTWVTIKKPEIIPEFRAHIVAERMSK